MFVPVLKTDDIDGDGPHKGETTMLQKEIENALGNIRITSDYAIILLGETDEVCRQRYGLPISSVTRFQFSKAIKTAHKHLQEWVKE